jgi:glycosyltransferase involved in cell wall biosynthesis
VKILLVTNSYPNPQFPIATIVENVALGFLRQGQSVRVVTHATGRWPRKFSIKGVEIVEYPITLGWEPRLYRHTEILASLRRSVLAWFELGFSLFTSFVYLAFESRGCDAVLAAWYLPSGLVAGAFRRFVAKPLIVCAFGAEFHLPNRWLVRALLGFVDRSADAVTVNSRYLAGKSANYGLDAGRLTVIPTTIALDQFPAHPVGQNEKVVMATMCRLVPAKRARDLIEAAAMLPEAERRQVELWIIGDGPERPGMERLAQEKGLSGQTRFLGMIPHDRIPETLRSVDIFVNPTMSDEGMPTTNIESMASGLCPVATRGYGNDEAIEDGKTGFLFEGGDLKTFSEILLKLVRDRELLGRIGRQASEYARAHHDVRRVADEYLALYQGLADRSFPELRSQISAPGAR